MSLLIKNNEDKCEVEVNDEKVECDENALKKQQAKPQQKTTWQKPIAYQECQLSNDRRL